MFWLSFRAPFPAADCRHVVAILFNILAMFDQLLANCLFEICSACTELRQPVDDVLDQMEAVHFIQDHHVERRRRRSFFLVAADVQIAVIGTAVGEPVDEPRIAVEGENDRLALGE